ncbi:MAG: hypothetical protein KDB04_12055 [Acidimicrobiales bacterium]|nr:hypothetical protein [Acidimicrobiales bacterium]
MTGALPGGPMVGLGEHEERYVAEAARHLADVPKAARVELGAIVAANLGERPPVATWDQLVAELGTPTSYVDALRAEHGLRGSYGPLHQLRRVPLRVALVVVAMLVVVGAVGWRRHADATADPGLGSFCGGVRADDPFVTVEQRSAAGATEELIGYVDGATVGLGTCLQADEGVELLDVDLGDAPSSLFEQTGVRAASMAVDPDAGLPELDAPLAFPPDGEGLRITIKGRLTDCERYGAGDGNGFDRVTVRFRYRGRERTETVPLIETYTFVSPPDDECPRPRPGG